jgi:hypothetical protein
MARLKNDVLFGGFDYRVILDDKISSCNYIERAKGCAYSETVSEHVCIKCMKKINWLQWNTTDTKATSVCSCGQKSSIEIISFHKVAK